MEIYDQKGKRVVRQLEIRREFIADRIEAIQKQGNHSDLSNLNVWNLRGLTIDFELLAEAIIERARKENYALLILDPIYKAMVGRSENSSNTVGFLCNQIDRIIEATGAAMIFAHHYTKGDAAKKNQIDRISGS
jgi:RecA-family ATPase